LPATLRFAHQIECGCRLAEILPLEIDADDIHPTGPECLTDMAARTAAGIEDTIPRFEMKLLKING
jgi:hypothetical protein